MRKIFGAVIILLIFGAIWFFFIKTYDYQFHFQAKNGPGTVHQEVKDWNTVSEKDSIDNIIIIENDPGKSILQKIDLEGNQVLLHWEFDYLNDSLTDITVYSLEKEHKFSNRFQILNPFSKSHYIEVLKNRLLAFEKRLRDRQKTYWVEMNGTTNSPKMNCACVTMQSNVNEKANTMMVGINVVEDYLQQNELTLAGAPMLKVNKWNRKTNLIEFDFCFPIINKVGLEPGKNVKLKSFKAQSSLMAKFHGNYRQSHFAWMDLVEKANRENIDVYALPLEVFQDNPRMGGESITWEADIYLPLK